METSEQNKVKTATGARALVEALPGENVDRVFGIRTTVAADLVKRDMTRRGW